MAAQIDWERVLKLEPQHTRARLHLARLLEWEADQVCYLHQYQEASSMYQRSLELWPRNSRARARLGVCYARLRQLERARREFEETLDLAEPKLTGHYWVICAWLELGRWKEAMAVLDRAEALEPPPPGFYLDLSAYCLTLWHDDWAVALWERAVGRFPDDASLLFKVAISYGEHGEAERAIALLRRVLELDPNDALAHMWLANYYYTALRQKRLAERHWRIAEELAQQAGNQQLLMFIYASRDFIRSGWKALPPELIMDLFNNIVSQAGRFDGSD